MKIKNLAFKRIGRWSILNIICWCLASCAMPGLIWMETPYQGPLIAGNNYAPVVQKCDSGSRGISDVIYCDSAFVDHHGNRVDITLDVRNKIDDYLIKVEPIEPWVIQTRTFTDYMGKKQTYKDAKERSRLPYRLHILTISPVIVLAVPRDKNDSEYCAGRMFKEGCLRTARLKLEPYWYKRNPKVADGSFWFSPTFTKTITYLPKEAHSYAIDLQDSRLELINEDGEWKITRTFNK